jgi:hypothetical protein
MKIYPLHIICIFFVLAFCSCKKDLGNYNYSPPTEPIVVNLQDATINALVGDTLIIQPYISFKDADPAKDLDFDWRIEIAEEARNVSYTGYPLKVVYNLAPGVRTAKLTVTDKRNGMKYFYPFKISGNTQFSKGLAVLSVQDGVTKLSFVKADTIGVLPDLYFALHHENLPNNPLQLFAKPKPFQPGSVLDYWVICADNTKSGVIIDGSTMLKKKTFPEQFFSPPATLNPQYFEASKGYATGVINDHLYISVITTAPFAEDWGKFSSPVAGNYELSKYFSNTDKFFFGYDKKRSAFVSFSAEGSYLDTLYNVKGNAFNPQRLGMKDLLFMKPVSGRNYAFLKGTDDQVYELSFNVDMDDYSNTRIITADSKRVFKGSSLINADTKWQRTYLDVFYFTSNDKIYRYNPINQDIRALNADFGGKKVTLLKLDDDDNKLIVGVDGALMFVDISVGVNGTIKRTVTGIPGTPVDEVSKN